MPNSFDKQTIAEARPYKAVFFDIGGVVVGSPFSGIAEYEKEHNLPHNYLNIAIAQAGPNGAFQKLERGEIDLWSFYDAFSEQLSNPENIAAYSKYARLRGKEFDEKSFKAPVINGRELFHQMMRKTAAAVPSMVQAIVALRQVGYKLAALTNNFDFPLDERGQREQELILKVTGQPIMATSTSTSTGTEATRGSMVMAQGHLKTLFDYYIESTVLGLRKPDPAIFKKACELVGVQPSEVVFLDDIGANLKSAEKLGMKTIRVELGKPEKAIETLESILGIKLLVGSSPTSVAKL
ncbi:hypothetical protein BX616_001374 [Lobosporangium transversale]|uniref:HAD-like domain-containing protein n=1 Tax=Lobosporangium transversale TaxID=64571 RepID=A0A1Y2GQG1_9FUNG|nr:HAD-like domain-containing protein [Lobosporangium transversale]KAF9904211.1 hypothetical protein BX616_001374 [Lobosporangium transversale]ORZ19119.1 HAD-like domain-containing protein [Lobosporangium transversale]|eukprot:XP_021882287.1 HAD-like domain-containing protein [Lobosporangium transversale]